MGVSLAPGSVDASVYGVTIGSLQEDMSVVDTAISGTLKYISDASVWNESAPWTAGTDDTGNYIAMKVTGIDTSIDDCEVELTGSEDDPIEITTNNQIICYRITDKTTQKIKLTTTIDSDEYVKTYDLSGLTLTPAPNNP